MFTTSPFFSDKNILLNQRGGMLKMLFKEKQSLISLICASICKDILTKLIQYSVSRHGFFQNRMYRKYPENACKCSLRIKRCWRFVTQLDPV